MEGGLRFGSVVTFRLFCLAKKKNEKKRRIEKGVA
jgi:hypothetical protein